MTGCVQRLSFDDVNRATVNVLAAEGCSVTTPAKQGCCGALPLHAGGIEQARRLAKHNIEVFEAAGVDRIVVNAAGCGSAMKEYKICSQADPAWAARAHAFSARVRDVSELLVELGEPRATRQPIRARVVYHDACHLAHGQGVRNQPRTLLQAIPGVELLTPAESEICCGSAGIYNLVQPEPAAQLGARKAQNIATLSPDMIATANPGLHAADLCGGARSWGITGRSFTPSSCSTRRFAAKSLRGARNVALGLDHQRRGPMWQHNYEPIGGSLGLSAPVAAIPIVVLFVMLGVLRKPAWMSAMAALVSALIVALAAYGMPAKLAVIATIYGAAYGVFPIAWIVFASIMLYRLAVDTGKFEIIKDSVGSLTDDRRLQAMFIAFSFGAFIEGAAGFGAPVAVSGAMLAGLGFNPVLRRRHLSAREHRAGRVRLDRHPGDDAGERHRASGAAAERAWSARCAR